jgi:hypothetical protein
MTKVSQPVGCVAVKQKVQHHTRCRRRNFEKGTVHGQRTKQCCPLPNFAVVTQLRHSSVVSPEPCLKHSVISTALLGLHEILYPSTAADGQTASVSNNTAFPLAGDASHAPPAKKHLTEPSPQDLDRRLLHVPHRAQKAPPTAASRYCSGFCGDSHSFGSFGVTR